MWGGLFCGILDTLAAFIVYGWLGLPPERLLQGIASGLLGRHAYAGGISAALLGLLLEFVIAIAAAAVYVAASFAMGWLTRRALTAGILYGIAVYWFMQLVVLPLSAYGRRPFSPELTVIGLAIHITCVGLPIAFATARFAPSPQHK